MKLLLPLQVLGALCLYAAAWVGRKKLQPHFTLRQALCLNNRVYSFYAAGFFAHLIAFLILLFGYPQFAQNPKLFSLPPWLTLALAYLFFGLWVIFAVPVPFKFIFTLRALPIPKDQGFNTFLQPQLVVTGAFKYCRHPMALGLYSFYAAFFILYPSPYTLISIFLGLIPAHLFFLVYYEQWELEVRFGQQFLDYKARTPFIFPRLWSFAHKKAVKASES